MSEAIADAVVLLADADRDHGPWEAALRNLRRVVAGMDPSVGILLPERHRAPAEAVMGVVHGIPWTTAAIGWLCGIGGPVTCPALAMLAEGLPTQDPDRLPDAWCGWRPAWERRDDRSDWSPSAATEACYRRCDDRRRAWLLRWSGWRLLGPSAVASCGTGAGAILAGWMADGTVEDMHGFAHPEAMPSSFRPVAMRILARTGDAIGRMGWSARGPQPPRRPHLDRGRKARKQLVRTLLSTPDGICEYRDPDMIRDDESFHEWMERPEVLRRLRDIAAAEPDFDAALRLARFDVVGLRSMAVH